MKLENQLGLERCPHCQVHRPSIVHIASAQTEAHSGENPRDWRIYKCMTCGGLVTAAARRGEQNEIVECYPVSRAADEAIPERARTFLNQAIESLHAPAGAILLCASAVDAMLKNKGFAEGTLYTRIDASAEKHLITKEMASWAHEVRLDANDQRHADESTAIPGDAEAQKCIAFTEALGEFLFALPARVKRGREKADVE